MGALDDITASLTADAKSFAMRKVVDYVAADPIGRLPQALTIIDKLDVRGHPLAPSEGRPRHHRVTG